MNDTTNSAPSEGPIELAALLALSVAAISARFGELDDAALKDLHDLEQAQGAKARSTLLTAIHAEQEARVRNAKAQEMVAAARAEGLAVYSRADLEAIQADYHKRLQALEEKLAKAQGATPASAVPSDPRVLSVTGDAEAPFCRVAFSDSENRTLPGLPDLQFSESAFAPSASLVRGGGGAGKRDVILQQPIVFPEGGRRGEVCKVWLVGANGKAAAVVELVNPLPIGGGLKGRLPEGSLRFDGVPAAA